MSLGDSSKYQYILERAMRVELTTSTLARLRSTTELYPQFLDINYNLLLQNQQVVNSKQNFLLVA